MPDKKIDLLFSPKQREALNQSIAGKVFSVMEHGQFILGPEVGEIQDTLAKYCGASYALGCGNGTDALTIALMAFDVQPGDVVISPNFTYIATVEAIKILGGIPLLVDIDDTYNIDIESLKSAVTKAKSEGWNLKGIISVDLFGRSANHKGIHDIAKENNLFYISDAAQSFGAIYEGKKVGTFADITTTSFFPTKPLGCYGDGGMIFTDNKEIAAKVNSIRFHGKGDDKYYHIRVGMNSRLDTIQAAVLLEKIKVFDSELVKRQDLASYYNDVLDGVVATPSDFDTKTSTWAVYSLLHGKRDAIIARLKESGIPSNVYYRTPLNQQPAYKDSLIVDDLSASMEMAEKVFCLPMHAYIEDERVYITDKLKKILKEI